MELGAGERGILRLQQLLKAASPNLRDQGASPSYTIPRDAADNVMTATAMRCL